MDVILWIIQILLAAIILTLGLIKLVVPIEKLGKAMEWTKDLSPLFIRIIGSIESVCAFCLFFPGLYPVPPKLIPLSATCLSVIMILAVIFHVKRGENNEIGIPVFIFILAAIIAVGRFII